METMTFGSGSLAIEELKSRIDRALIVRDAAGESITSCYMQMTRDLLDEPPSRAVISRHMQ